MDTSHLIGICFCPAGLGLRHRDVAARDLKGEVRRTVADSVSSARRPRSVPTDFGKRFGMAWSCSSCKPALHPRRHYLAFGVRSVEP